jgi:RNA polymerase sigma-70 factor (ECF subfamily)
VSQQNHDAADWRRLLIDQLQQHKRLFFHLAYGVLRDADRSEDACQQALLQAWRHRDEIRETGALRGWLSRTIINESLAMLRRQQTEERLLQQQPSSPNGSEDPAETVATRDLVVAGLAELAEPTRTVVVLRTMQGMSGGEVSRFLHVSHSEVSRRLHLGLEQLRGFVTAQQR